MSSPERARSADDLHPTVVYSRFDLRQGRYARMPPKYNAASSTEVFAVRIPLNLHWHPPHVTASPLTAASLRSLII